MHALHKPVVRRSTTNRSAITNGSKLLVGIDGCHRYYEIFSQIRPERPRTLAWHPTDPVGYFAERAGEGRTRLWCNYNDIEALRGRTSFHQWIFTGTREEQLRLLPDWRDNRSVPPGYEHLFISVGDEFRRKRAQELIAARDEYQAAADAAEVAAGYRAAQDVLDALYEKTSDLNNRILEMTPSTLEGFRAMASAVVHYCWCGEIDRGETTDMQMIAIMLSSLTGMATAA
jgi:hypothetical protein